MALKQTLRQASIHLVIAWLAINIFHCINFLYKTAIWGDMTLNADGTPYSLAQMLVSHNLRQPDFLYLIPFILLVEFNYHFIFKKYHLIIFFLTSVSIGKAVVIAMLKVNFFFFRRAFQPDYLELMLVLIAYAIVYAFIREFFHQRLHKVQVRLSHSESELQALKQQLNPHFLFNTLNYLYGTALQENAERTAAGIDLVAGMMRYSVNGMQQTFVPLDEELQFIESYLQLQKLRMPLDDTHTVETSIETDGKPGVIAPMLLIQFIENAFKFGISTDQPSFIKLKLAINNGKLIMQIDNSVKASENPVKGTNSGLAITKKRLELLYPEKYKLEIDPGLTGYHIQLSLQLS